MQTSSTPHTPPSCRRTRDYTLVQVPAKRTFYQNIDNETRYSKTKILDTQSPINGASQTSPAYHTPSQSPLKYQATALPTGKFRLLSLTPNSFSDTTTTEHEDFYEAPRISIYENAHISVEKAFNEVKSNIGAFTRFVYHNFGFSKINEMIGVIVASNEKLLGLAHKLRPLSAISLKNLALLKREVEHIIDWRDKIELAHREYMQYCRYLCVSLGYDVIDFSKLNILSLIRKNPRFGIPCKNKGFVAYKKI